MKTAERTITRQMTDGRTVEIKVEMTRGVRDDVGYADGWNVHLGKKTIDSIDIILRVDGRLLAKSYNNPEILSPRFYKDKITAGAYARIGDGYVTKERYDDIMTMIAEIEAEIGNDAEYDAVKKAEEAKKETKNRAEKREAEEYEKALANGLCPKCGTYCYGDCEA